MERIWIPKPHTIIFAPNTSGTHPTASTPTYHTESSVGPKTGTWCRIRPPAYAMDNTETMGQLLGPKCKCDKIETQSAIFIDKKQKRLDEETKALGKLMADNLGSGWLLCSTVSRNNEYFKLELSGVWESPNS